MEVLFLKVNQYCLQFHLDFIYDVEVVVLQLQFHFWEQFKIAGRAMSGEHEQWEKTSFTNGVVLMNIRAGVLS